MKTSSAQSDQLTHTNSHLNNSKDSGKDSSKDSGKDSSKDTSMMEPNEVFFMFHKTYDTHTFFLLHPLSHPHFHPLYTPSKTYACCAFQVVFMGHKTYDKHFIFWQLIGWFHAGTDQKAEAPDLFGCVQLPLPAACFGTSEMQYGAKQRESLLAHLREEKAQTLPWPPLVKACFETSHVKALATRYVVNW